MYKSLQAWSACNRALTGFRPWLMVTRRKLLLSIACVAIASCSAPGQSNSGVTVPAPNTLTTGASLGRAVAATIQPVRIIDGDTLILGEQRHRLFGIDSPERNQRCNRDDETSWDCGQLATEHLQVLVAEQAVHCNEVPDTQDRYGRQISRCYAGNIELNEAMVSSGYAWAFRRYSSDYIAAEEHARSQGLGVWQAPTDTPWHIRAIARAKIQADHADNNDPPMPGCDIKGNISTAGHLYHLPSSRAYAKTRIDLSRGERWFCTMEEAQEAGWRAAR